MVKTPQMIQYRIFAARSATMLIPFLESPMRGKFAFLCLYSCLLQVGCGGSSPASSTSPPTPLSGNYEIHITSSVSLGVSADVGGIIVETNGQVTATMRINRSPCYFTSDLVTFTGKRSGSSVSVTSGSIRSQIITISGTASADGSQLTGVTYSIAGGCASGDQGTGFGAKVAALNATYSGILSPINGPQFSVLITVTQSSTPGPDGLYQLAVSSLALGSTSCISNGETVNGEIAGTFVSIFIGNPLEVAVVAQGKDTTMTNLTAAISGVGGPCSGDTALGNLTKQ